MRCKSPRTYHICLLTSYVRVLDRIIFIHLFIYVIVGCIDFILIILKVASNNDNKFDKKGSRAARDYQQEDITRYRYCYKNGKSLIFKSWINRYFQPIFCSHNKTILMPFKNVVFLLILKWQYAMRLLHIYTHKLFMHVFVSVFIIKWFGLWHVNDITSKKKYRVANDSSSHFSIVGHMYVYVVLWNRY